MAEQCNAICAKTPPFTISGELTLQQYEGGPNVFELSFPDGHKDTYYRQTG